MSVWVSQNSAKRIGLGNETQIELLMLRYKDVFKTNYRLKKSHLFQTCVETIVYCRRIDI